ncbi:DUF5606 domain-containing protein [Hymenobacter sp. ASUV-10]|uniref:DUF5606 domain-containing protein n=1 Tax=Hymenobacter aranciens TaxID=3063996 RepID=A0ABT9BA63_9BACT|nr:DUF5606 domain-containing protein [Hymenobacter sp. ASUV-10]MDO7873927.1 DUF5606 domain-containing protein [Hymenobacter sp. ASUV-10]
MPYNLQEVAAISGMPGLFRLLRAARQGVLVESLDERKSRSMAPARNKVSLLADISIYTEDPDVTVPLTEVFERIYQQHGTNLTVTNKSSEDELSGFLAGVIPDYDRDRVYLSDIKKLASWYGIVSKHLPYQAADAATETTATHEASAEEVEAPKAKGKAQKAAEPVSTGGEITSTADADADAAGNPEATTPKKGKKKAE